MQYCFLGASPSVEDEAFNRILNDPPFVFDPLFLFARDYPLI